MVKRTFKAVNPGSVDLVVVLGFAAPTGVDEANSIGAGMYPTQTKVGATVHDGLAGRTHCRKKQLLIVLAGYIIMY